MIISDAVSAQMISSPGVPHRQENVSGPLIPGSFVAVEVPCSPAYALSARNGYYFEIYLD